MIVSPACGRGKHGKCAGAFEVKERGERLAVLCSCNCHAKRGAEVLI